MYDPNIVSWLFQSICRSMFARNMVNALFQSMPEHIQYDPKVVNGLFQSLSEHVCP